jgi:hypothetical protein
VPALLLFIAWNLAASIVLVNRTRRVSSPAARVQVTA